MLSSTALMRSTALLSLAASAWAAATSYDVLSLFYRTTNGAQWHNNEGWLTGDPCDGTWMTKSKYDCYSGELTGSYQPICCDLVSLADTSPRVTKLDLFDNNLRGTIPKEIVRQRRPRATTARSPRHSGTQHAPRESSASRGAAGDTPADQARLPRGVGRWTCRRSSCSLSTATTSRARSRLCLASCGTSTCCGCTTTRSAAAYRLRCAPTHSPEASARMRCGPPTSEAHYAPQAFLTRTSLHLGRRPRLLQLGKLTTFVQRGCYLQNNSFVYCPPVQSTTAGTGDTTSTTLQLPAECTTDGPASPTDWIGLGAIPCANASTGSGGGSTSTTAERKEYSTGGLCAARAARAHRARPCCLCFRRLSQQCAPTTAEGTVRVARRPLESPIPTRTVSQVHHPRRARRLGHARGAL
eukprot:6951394-Prymnesium_polylepis.1